MTLSPRAKRNIIQMIPFGVISFISSTVYALIEKGILGSHPIYPSTGNPYNFNWLLPSIIAGLFGLLIGFLEIQFLSKWFQKGSFTSKLIFKSTIYLFLTVIFALVVTSIGTAYELGNSPFSNEVWEYNYKFLVSFAFWTILIYITLGLVISLFYTEVSNNIGQNVLLNSFTGKYHHPVEEERIFMFLDMKSSTEIAEKLGHVKYFKLLKEYYSDLSDPIITYGGEIYQYVGDEVVVTWKLSEKRRTNSINCFFSMQASLANQVEKYESRYGVCPTFKAGMHVGNVTTGEIGVIKKDIVFTGDVLNTTARIQGLCNTYQVELLLSKQIVQALELEKSFDLIELGERELRGKNEKVILYTIERTFTPLET